MKNAKFHDIELKPISSSSPKENNAEPKLNSEQIEAINSIEGNLLIIASAGTGKTTTIVERYVNLVENHNIRPNRILMTTFTNKAAKDMIRKISERTQKIPYYAGTMHSIFLNILRNNSKEILPHQNFTIIDDSDRKKIIREILKLEKIDTKADNIKYFLGRISTFKNRAISAESLESMSLEEKEEKIEVLMDDERIFISSKLKALAPTIYKKYDLELRKRNVIDLDDILLLTFQLFKNNEKILQIYKNQFSIIMVDEAQDLNYVQIEILNLLENNNLCLIGDDCQNIYEWRGSSNDLVFKFNDHYKKIVLKENYRSTKEIITAVNSTIQAMKFKIDKELRCTRDKGEKICIEGFSTFYDEIEYIISEILDLLKKGTKKEDISILFRTNNLGKQIEREFRKHGIPCRLTRAKNFFEREEIKDLLSFLKLKVNPHALIEFERVLMLLGGLGKAKVKKFISLSEKHNCSILDSLDYTSEIKLDEKLIIDLSRLKETLRNETFNPIESFMKLFDYEEMLQLKYEDDPEKVDDKTENIEVIKEIFKGYTYDKEGIKQFLDSLLDLEKKEKDKDKITLSTIHSAKGLEWKYVFLAACNEKILPYYKDELSNLDHDSELRLFYVAISRAKDHLTITYSHFANWKQLEPSQFLDIIN